MRHHTRLMESGLPVHEQDISVREVSVDDLLADLELVSKAISFFLWHVL